MLDRERYMQERVKRHAKGHSHIVKCWHCGTEHEMPPYDTLDDGIYTCSECNTTLMVKDIKDDTWSWRRINFPDLYLYNWFGNKVADLLEKRREKKRRKNERGSK